MIRFASSNKWLLIATDVWVAMNVTYFSRKLSAIVVMHIITEVMGGHFVTSLLLFA